MANKVRVDNVFGASFHPHGFCEGPDDNTSCSWDSPQSPSTRERAKRHAKSNPGHRVFVDTLKRDIYVAQVVE